MMTPTTYSIGYAVLAIASLLVLVNTTPTAVTELDKCSGVLTCKTCVGTKVNGGNDTCVFESTRGGFECVKDAEVAEGVIAVYKTETDCAKIPDQPTPPPTTTTTTVAPTNATTTTPSTTTTSATTPTTTNATTPASTTTPTPTTPTTTTTVAPTTSTPNSTSTSTAAPSTTTTAVPSPTPEPRSGSGMSVASFFGGIVFTLGVSAVGYLVWRFYKVRMDRNYHTLSTNLI